MASGEGIFFSVNPYRLIKSHSFFPNLCQKKNELELFCGFSKSFVLNNGEMIVDEVGTVVHDTDLLPRIMYIISLVGKEKRTLLSGSLGTSKI